MPVCIGNKGCLIFGDVHAVDWTIPLLERAFSIMHKYSVENEIRQWFCTGDWLDRVEWENYKTLWWLKRELNYIYSSGITIYSVRGNHDRESFPLLESFGIVFLTEDNFASLPFTVYHLVPGEIPYFGEVSKPASSFDKNRIHFFGHWHQPSLNEAGHHTRNNFFFTGSLIPVEFGALDMPYYYRFFHFLTLNNIKSMPLDLPRKITLSARHFLVHNNMYPDIKDSLRIYCDNIDELKKVKTIIGDRENIKIIPNFCDIVWKETTKIGELKVRDIIKEYAKRHGVDPVLGLKVWEEAGGK